MKLLVLVAILTTSSIAAAQGPREITLDAGDTVRIVHRSMFDRGPAMRQPGRRVDYLYVTRLAASDADGRQRQADRLAAQLGREAEDLGVRALSVGICDTPACAQGRQPPSNWYLYEHRDGSWRRVSNR